MDTMNMMLSKEANDFVNKIIMETLSEVETRLCAASVCGKINGNYNRRVVTIIDICAVIKEMQDEIN